MHFGASLFIYIKYTYDGFGRTISASSNGKVQNYSYDANSNLVGYTLKENDATLNSINYTYDKLNRLTQMSVDDIITSYTYNANSQLTSKSVSNGLVTNYGYNKAGLIVNMVNKKGEDIYNNYSSTYTLNGLKKSEAESGVQTKTYQYDKLGRLTNEQVANAENSVVLNNSFTYDNFGNRETMVSGDITNTYTYDANNRLLKSVKTENGIDEITSYSYDKNGNQLTWYKSTISPNGGEESYSLTDETDGTDYGYYTYDAFNRLSSYTNGVTNASYTYGADNLRKSKTVDGVTTNYVWNGSNMVLEENGTETNKYYYGADGIVFADFNGTTNYYQKNAHGDVTALTNASGAITRNYQFDAFGNELTNNTNDINPFRYAGEYQDLCSGLIYLRNRYYDSNNGRFITEDPIKDGLNWYAYCGNDPINFIDFWGLYDRKKAVAYATNPDYVSPERNDNGILKRFRKHNPQYERFDNIVDKISSFVNTGVLRLGSDCANFASQVLVAGGIKMTDTWHYYIKTVEEWHSNNSVEIKQRDMSSAWANASDMYAYFKNPDNGYINGNIVWVTNMEEARKVKSEKNVQVGDLVFFYNDTDSVHHAAILTGFNNDGTIQYSGHSNDRINYTVNKDVLSGDSIIIIRIRDDV